MEEKKTEPSNGFSEIESQRLPNEALEIDAHYDAPDGAPNEKLHRGLKARQITMIAIGGAIGTGLIIGTGSALAQAGPGSILISYSIVGIVVWLVMCAIGEMAGWLPLEGGFAAFADRYCDDALGFALGYSYWFKYIVVTPNQLTAAALVIQYWCPPERVNPGVFITVFLVTIIFINYFGIRIFGEFEFWLSSFKVIVVLGIILLCFVIMLGGGPDRDRRGFRYYRDPGAFATYINDGDSGRFIAFWSSMVTAVFAYLGTELVGVTMGEAENPRKNIPKAIRLTFYRILVFYILTVFLLGLVVPYNAPKLLNALNNKGANSSVAASPFVVAVEMAGIKVLPGILNGCILLFVFSASNSDLYIASRTIYGLAREGKAPRVLARTDKRGVPIVALGLCSLFCCLAYMNVSSSSRQVFLYFVNLVTIFGLLTWISILVAHIYFVRAQKAQKVNRTEMPFRAPLGVGGTWFALIFCILVALTKNFPVFVTKDGKKFDYKSFITGYIGIPLYIILIFGYKLVKKTKTVDPHKADLWTGRAEYNRDGDAWDLKEKERLERGGRGAWFYRKFLSWLF